MPSTDPMRAISSGPNPGAWIGATTTGIRRTNTGAWAVIIEGRFVRDFTGPGAKAKAIEAAGTNAVVA